MKKSFVTLTMMLLIVILTGCGSSKYGVVVKNDSKEVADTTESTTEELQIEDENSSEAATQQVAEILDEDAIPTYKEVSDEMGSDEYLHKYSTFVSDDYVVYTGLDMEGEETVYKVHIVIKEINGYTYAQETMYGDVFLCFRGTGTKYVPMSHKLELPDGEIIDMQEVFDSYIEAPEMVNESNRAGLGLFK